MIDTALELALDGEFKKGMIINGLVYGSAMGLDREVAVRALCSGAAAAGISGTGPATVILCDPVRKDEIVQAVGEERLITTKLNRKKAGIYQ